MIAKANSYKTAPGIYGLHQSPRVWFHHLHNFQFSLDFTRSLVEPSLFILRSKCTIFILMYVDDKVIIGSSLVEVNKVLVIKPRIHHP